jgi:enoyl-[acyl-carrier protein] reductase I
MKSPHHHARWGVVCLRQQQRHNTIPTTTTTTTTIPVPRIYKNEDDDETLFEQNQQQRRRKVALIMGVYNWRSIAWTAVRSFIESGYDCIMTYKSDADCTDEFDNGVTELGQEYMGCIQDILNGVSDDENDPIAKRELGVRERAVWPLYPTLTPHLVQDLQLHALPCNVETTTPGQNDDDDDVTSLFREKIPKVLQQIGATQLDCIVHSIAYANLSREERFMDTSLESYHQAQQISAFSLVQVAREVLENDLLRKHGALTTLSYLGAVRAVPQYKMMGVAKATLESIVRGLALELGSPPHSVRCNAVSAGPIRTVSAMGIGSFRRLHKHVQLHSPLERHVQPIEVAETIRWISTNATGITGQTIYVDCGYSAVTHIMMKKIGNRGQIKGARVGMPF